MSVLSLDAYTQTAQPNPTQCRDASSQVAPRSVAFKDASTQLSFAEFFERSILSQALPPRPIPLLQPGDSGPIPVPRTQCDRTQPPPPGLEEQTLLRMSHNSPSKAAPARLPSSHGLCSSSPGAQPSSQLPPAPQPYVSTTPVGPHPTLSTAAHKRSASTALARTHLATSTEARAGRGPFPKPMPTITPMVRFGLPKPPGHGHLHNADSDLMHHQYRLSVLQGNPGPAGRNPTQNVAATCGRFHAVNPTRSQ